MNQRILR
jgi:HrpA-like RNA helicase